MNALKSLKALLAAVLAIALLPSAAFASGETPEGGESAFVSMELDATYEVEAEEGESAYYSFTAPETSYYKFYSSDNEGSDPVADFYADPSLDNCIGMSDDDASNSNFSFALEIESGDTVYMRAYGYGLSFANYQVQVSEVDIYDISAYGFGSYTTILGVDSEPNLEAFGYGNELVQGVDFEVVEYEDNEGNAYSDMPSAEGQYLAKIQGIDPYYGTASCWFDLCLPTDLQYATVLYDGEEWIDDVVYTGSPVSISLEVTAADGTLLEEGTHYEVVYADYEGSVLNEAPSAVGSYSVYAKALEDSGYVNSTYSAYFAIYDPYEFDPSYSYAYLESDVFLYTGSAIEPAVQVECHGEWLTAGEDFTVEYSNNIGSPSEETTAIVTVSPSGAYHGSDITVEFTIAPYLDIAQLVDDGDYSLRWEDRSSSWSSTFLYEGRAIKPNVDFHAYGEDAKQGVDYFITYLDSEGNEVTPKDPGAYSILVKGTEDGLCRGEAEIPFNIVSTINIADHADFWLENAYTWVDGGEYVILDGEKASWHATSWGVWGSSDMVEGYDYDVIETFNESTGCYDVTFVGKGVYEGTATATYRYAEPSEKDLSIYAWYVNGSYADDEDDPAYVEVLEDGSIAAPVVASHALTYGLDYEVAGYINEDGEEIESAQVGEYLFVRVVGLGEYENCTHLIKVKAVSSIQRDEASTDFADCQIWTEALWAYDSDTDDLYFVWLSGKTEDPEIFVDMYGNPVEGVHYEKIVERNSSIGVLTITVSAIEGSGYEGSKSIEIKLVDKYDLNLVAWLDAADELVLPGGTAAYPDYRVYVDNASGSFTLTEGEDFDSTLTDPSGAEVSECASNGEYVLAITGVGDYTGTITKQFSVSVIEEISLNYADIQFSNSVFRYEGSPIEPEVSVRYGGFELEEGVDFNVSYHNNNGVGKAYALITPVEGSAYCGSVARSFTILESYSLSSAEIVYYDEDAGKKWSLSDSIDWPTVKFEAGDKAEPSIIVYDWAEQTSFEVNPKYYDVAYGNNAETGIAWVKVTGKNGFAGTISGNFFVEEEPLSTENIFSDVNESTYHAEAIWWLYDNGITTGFADGTFRPLNKIARCDMAAFLYRLAGPESYEPSAAAKAAFTDVNESTYHAEAIWWLYDNGITTGFPDRTFRPMNEIARCDMAAFLYRLAGDTAAGYEPSAAAKAAFTDVNESTYHAEAIWWLYDNGITTGFPDRTFRPMNEIARCDMAAFLYRQDAKDLVGKF